MKYLSLWFLFVSLLVFSVGVSCSRMSEPKKIVFYETVSGVYSHAFHYDPKKSDSFNANMTLIRSGLSHEMMNGDISINIRNLKGGNLFIKTNQGYFEIRENEKKLVYLGKFKDFDNDGKSTFLSYTSDSKVSFEVTIESEVGEQIVAVKWAYASGG